MPRCTVTLSANAGAVLELNLVRIWLDLLHTQKTENFSTVGPELQRRMRNVSVRPSGSDLFYPLPSRPLLPDADRAGR